MEEYMVIMLCYYILSVVGAGVGLGYLPAILLVLTYFKRKQRIAISISVSGLGLGAMTFPHIIRCLDVKYGWRGALLILSGVTLHIPVIGLICRSLQNSTNHLRSDHKSGLTNFHMFRNIKYILISIHFTLSSFAASIILVHLASYSSNRGYGKYQGHMLYTIMELTDLISRLLLGVLIQLSCLTTMELYTGFLMVAVVVPVLTPFATAYYALCLLAVCYGCYLALSAVFLPLITADILPKEEVPIGLGFIFVCEAAGYLAGAPMAGKMASTCINMII